MIINEIYLKNFRSYTNIHLKFHPHLTFICGPNAVGKTNILEAISLLSMGKSFRNAKDKSIIKEGGNNYFIACSFDKNKKNKKLSYACEQHQEKNKRKIKKDNQLLGSRRELIGEMIVVIMSPNDLSLVEGISLYRRRFLDSILSFQNQEYFQSLLHLTKSLEQRNNILKEIKRKGSLKNERVLEVWDKSLVKNICKINKERNEFIKTFKDIFRELLLKISHGKDKVDISLYPILAEDEINIQEYLKKNLKKDIQLGYTSEGPHRQNLLFEKTGNKINTIFSQGQKRSVVLALKIAQFYYLKEKLNLKPILLIDDVIGDLDILRKKAFIELLNDCGQAIITTPDSEYMQGNLLGLKNSYWVYEIPRIDTLPILQKNT